MEPADAAGPHDPITENMYTGSQNSFPGDLIDSSDLSKADREQITQLINALARLREVERALSEASRRYMELSEQDMRALHYLIAAIAGHTPSKSPRRRRSRHERPWDAPSPGASMPPPTSPAENAMPSSASSTACPKSCL
ncbi:hypothetical protein SAMN04489752_1293 [Brevibacterium siliguriense]|uniref:Uncharacterized protein n=1 Tax=Brevibacterium siliguriense TaxID=1136497 RepID=A0A1H1QN30_9MICO|nr:hypothetical protein SAMN04489752_1293 [Brevibacterium siliguriense]